MPRFQTKGKREGNPGLHRAGSRIPSGRGNHEASATEIYRHIRGKGEMVREELTAWLVTGRAYVNLIRSKTEMKTIDRPDLFSGGSLELAGNSKSR